MLKKLPNFLKPTKKKIIILAVIVLVISLICVGVNNVKKQKALMASSQNTLSEVTRGNVESTITGSGAVEPNERYEIIPLVNGEIMSSPYEVGEYVEKGTVLYTFDTADAEITLQKQENALEKTQMTHQQTLDTADKLKLTAPCDGILSEMDLEVGDEIKNNAVISKITNTKSLKVDLPFNESQVKTISKGQTATISSSAHMNSVTGKVTHIDSNPTAQADGSLLYNVTVSFTNPGSFTSGLSVGGEINGNVSPKSGTIRYAQESNITSETEGTITRIYHKSGDYVKKDAVIATVENDTITNDIKKSELDYSDAKLSLQERLDTLDDYSLTAPISGSVLTKNSKAGDTIDKTNASVTMMVIADVSKLKFKLDIDELDVNKVTTGQEVQITCDAIEGEDFVGEITEISMEGTSSNGVTTYTATVTIDNPGELKPSMNVDATIIVESAENVLRVPAADIKTNRSKSFVFVPEDTDVKDKDKSKQDDTDKTQKGNNNGVSNGGKGGMPTAPDGFTVVEITIGVQGDEYTEVISGLSEGDKIYQQTTSSSNNDMMMMGGGNMGGGMSSGPNGGGGGGGPRG